MKILLGNNTLDLKAGSETWLLTLATELKRLGHDVTAYSPFLGFIAMQLEAIDVRCISELRGSNPAPTKFSLGMVDNEIDQDFDVIICNHHKITKDLHAAFPTVPIIATVHGILHKDVNTGEIWPEHPVTDFKVDQYVAVSPEVQGLLKEVHGLDSVVIPNFFDLDRFSWRPTPPESGDYDGEHTLNLRKPTGFLVNTNYMGKEDPAIQTIMEVSRHYGAQVRALGMNFVESWDIQDAIKDVDVVFGMGRSVLEGFCMGKISVVQGRWGTGGVITQETYPALSESNFSGRSSQGKYASAEELISMIDSALNHEQFEWQRKTVLANHDVKVAAKRYLEISEGLIK